MSVLMGMHLALSEPLNLRPLFPLLVTIRLVTRCDRNSVIRSDFALRNFLSLMKVFDFLCVKFSVDRHHLKFHRIELCLELENSRICLVLFHLIEKFGLKFEVEPYLSDCGVFLFVETFVKTFL